MYTTFESLEYTICARNSKKFFTRNCQGEFKFCVSGQLISYVVNVRDLLHNTLTQERIIPTNDYVPIRVQFKDVFVSHEMLSYMSIAGQHLTEIIMIPPRTHCWKPGTLLTIPLTADNIVTTQYRAIQTLLDWQPAFEVSECLSVTGWVLDR